MVIVIVGTQCNDFTKNIFFDNVFSKFQTINNLKKYRISYFLLRIFLNVFSLF